jgi:hypothetical protein
MPGNLQQNRIKNHIHGMYPQERNCDRIVSLKQFME